MRRLLAINVTNFS